VLTSDAVLFILGPDKGRSIASAFDDFGRAIPHALPASCTFGLVDLELDHVGFSG
jgi:hypothetical protein